MWHEIHLGFQSPVAGNLHCSINVFNKYKGNNGTSFAVHREKEQAEEEFVSKAHKY